MLPSTLDQDLLKELDAIRDREAAREPKAAVGASMIGHPCDAYLALSLRGMPETSIPAKTKRIFDLGHAVEEIVEKDLEKAVPRALPGASVSFVDSDGFQFGARRYGAFLRSRADGMIDYKGKRYLLEIKSMNKTLFNRCEKVGVKVSHPKYNAQMQAMMGMWGIEQCLFLAQCKDDSRYLAQVVSFDLLEYHALLARMEVAINNSARRISNDPDNFNCRFCPQANSCWGVDPIPPACSRCRFAEPSKDGSFFCTIHDRKATEACPAFERYSPLPKE